MRSPMDSIFSSLAARAAAQPEAPAFIDGKGVLTYRELLEGAEQAAQRLWQQGVRARARVALPLGGRAAGARRTLKLFYGLAYLGAVVLPLYPEMAPAARAALPRRYGLRLIDLRGLAAGGPARARAPRGDDPARPFLYEFTSGTTGAAKALLLTQAQLAGVARAGAAADGWLPDDRVLPIVPWPSKAAARYLLRVHGGGGALVNLEFPRSRQELAARVRAAGVTAFCGSVEALRLLLKSTPAPGETLPPLRALRVSGAPMRPEELRALRAQITPNVHFCYGTTETGMIAALRPGEPVGDTLALRPVAPGLEAQAVGMNDEALPAGTVGQLRYRAPWVPDKYAGNPEASARHFRGGWFYPGDLGSIDAAGRIVLQGRADDVINFCGAMIVPQDIEPVLARFPGVDEVAVVGVPHPSAGQLPVAFVVARGAIDRAAWRKFCEHHIGDLRSPRRVIRVRELPRNPAGKLARERLVALYRRASGDNVAHG